MLCLGLKETIEFLIEQGAVVDQRNLWGHTALIYAAKHGHKGAVDSLIRNGANANHVSDDGSTPLMWAAESGN